MYEMKCINGSVHIKRANKAAAQSERKIREKALRRKEKRD